MCSAGAPWASSNAQIYFKIQIFYIQTRFPVSLKKLEGSATLGYVSRWQQSAGEQLVSSCYFYGGSISSHLTLHPCSLSHVSPSFFIHCSACPTPATSDFVPPLTPKNGEEFGAIPSRIIYKKSPQTIFIDTAVFNTQFRRPQKLTVTLLC